MEANKGKLTNLVASKPFTFKKSHKPKNMSAMIIQMPAVEWPVSGGWHIAFFSLIVVGLLVALVVTVQRLGLLLFDARHRKSASCRNAAFLAFVCATLFAGILVYFVGYDAGGTRANAFTLLMRSTLSALEMFLSKSNLIGVKEGCKNDEFYMLAFAVVHVAAVVASAIFTVACFRKRLTYWWRGWRWAHSKNEACLNVFWGLGERTYMMASELQKGHPKDERIVFVDIPDKDEKPSGGQSFSGLLGLLAYKLTVAKKASRLNYILMRSTTHPTNVQERGDDFWDALDLKKIGRFIKHAGTVRFFVLGEDETTNATAAIHLAGSGVFKDVDDYTVYCSARKTALMRLIEVEKDRHIAFIDESRTAVTELKLKGEAGKTYPIDYVKTDSRGQVCSPFNALIVGFGTTGQDALRFLYEFSSFVGLDGRKSKVCIDVVDGRMAAVVGEFRREVPGMDEFEDKEVFFHEMETGSNAFEAYLRSKIERLNYVVVATGDEQRNLRIASSILDMALPSHAQSMVPLKVFVRRYSDDNTQLFDTARNIYNKLSPDVIALDYFGSPQAVYTREVVINNIYEVLAKKFFAAYQQETNDTQTWDDRRYVDPKATAFEQSYIRQGIYRKEGQDKANALHARTKERLLRLSADRPTKDLPDWEALLEKVTSGSASDWEWRLYHVALCEHLRWNASHLMMGYTKMSVEDYKKGGGKPSCREETKQHVCLTDWEHPILKPYRKYDYAVVKTTINEFLSHSKKTKC